MANLLVQSASPENLAKSILRPVKLQHFANLLSARDLTELNARYPDGNCWVWGLTPGPANKRFWDRLQEGDDVAIITSEGVRCYALITYKEQNRNLALSIWGPARSGKAYELVYFSTRPEVVSVSLDQYNRLTGYRYRHMPQNAFILDPKKAQTVRSFKNNRSLSRLLMP